MRPQAGPFALRAVVASAKTRSGGIAIAERCSAVARWIASSVLIGSGKGVPSAVQDGARDGHASHASHFMQ